MTQLAFLAGEPVLISSGGDNALKMWFCEADTVRLLRERAGHGKKRAVFLLWRLYCSGLNDEMTLKTSICLYFFLMIRLELTNLLVLLFVPFWLSLCAHTSRQAKRPRSSNSTTAFPTAASARRASC